MSTQRTLNLQPHPTPRRIRRLRPVGTRDRVIARLADSRANRRAIADAKRHPALGRAIGRLRAIDAEWNGLYTITGVARCDHERTTRHYLGRMEAEAEAAGYGTLEQMVADATRRGGRRIAMGLETDEPTR